MMNISQKNNDHPSQEIEALSVESQSSEVNEKRASGFTLDQLFNQDSLEILFPIEMLSHTAELESKTSSFWSKIWSWWYQPDLKTQTSLLSSSQNDLLEVCEVEPIGAVPVLEEPDIIPADLRAAKLPPITKKTNGREMLSQSQLNEALSLMSERTIEQILFIVLKAQIEIEKESANSTEKTFSKYQDYKKLQEQVLQEIKDVLARDAELVGYLKTAQNLALAASFVCGIAAALVSAPAAVAFGAVVSPAVFAHVTLAGTFGPVVAAALTGLTTGTKAYFQRRLNEDKAKHETNNHQDKYYSDRIEDARQHIMSTADADNVFKERLIQLLKRFKKMCKIVSEK
jgi:hypothetical protein